MHHCTNAPIVPLHAVALEHAVSFIFCNFENLMYYSPALLPLISPCPWIHMCLHAHVCVHTDIHTLTKTYVCTLGHLCTAPWSFLCSVLSLQFLTMFRWIPGQPVGDWFLMSFIYKMEIPVLLVQDRTLATNGNLNNSGDWNTGVVGNGKQLLQGICCSRQKKCR